MTTQEPVKQKKSKGRSPSYPAIDLETAIKRAKELYDQEHMNAASTSVILSHWGYNIKSGGGLVTLAALLKFGLLTDEGSGEKRMARLTELARKIILDDRQTSPERDILIQEAALMPTVHKELWSQYKGILPSDENLRHELRVNRGFTDYAVSDLIEEFRSTVAFAKLTQSVILSEEGKDKTPSESENNMVATIEQENKQQKPSTLIKYSWPLSKSVTADVIINGANVSSKDLEMLRKYLELAKGALEEQNS